MWGKDWRKRFTGAHVLITGGSSGIGLELARQLASAGAKITLLARTKSTLEAAAAELRQVPSVGMYPAASVSFQSADVCQAQQLTAAIQAAEKQHGPVDFLICNAGAAQPGYFLDQELAVFERSMQLNYLGTVAAIKAVLGGMVARNHGHICIISSVMGSMGFVGYSSYSPSKYALKGLAECLRSELQGTALTVSVAFPPDTDTPGLQKEDATKPKETKDISALSTVFSVQSVAKCILTGIAAGQFTLSTPDIGLNLHLGVMQGLIPRGVLSTLSSMLVGILAPLIQCVYGVLFDRIARQTAQQRFAKLWAVGSTHETTHPGSLFKS